MSAGSGRLVQSTCTRPDGVHIGTNGVKLIMTHLDVIRPLLKSSKRRSRQDHLLKPTNTAIVKLVNSI
jgi:hypothetical protein